MAELTKSQVLAALEREIEQTDQGFQCRICTRTFPSRNAVPVHELTHRRVVGLAPPMRSGPAAPKWVVCGYEGCTDRMKRTSLPSHLMSQKHGMDRSQASFYAAERREEEVNGNGPIPGGPMNLPPMKITEGEATAFLEAVGATPKQILVPVTEIEAADFVTALVMAVRKDRGLPAVMIPSLFELTGHVEQFLAELRDHDG